MYFTATSIHKIDRFDAIATLNELWEHMIDVPVVKVNQDTETIHNGYYACGFDITSLLHMFQDRVISKVSNELLENIWKPWLTKRVCNIVDSYQHMYAITNTVLKHQDGLDDGCIQNYYELVVQCRANLSFLLSDMEIGHINDDDTWGSKDANLTELAYGVTMYDALNQRLYESYPDLFNGDIAPFVDFERLYQSMHDNLKTQQAIYYVKDVYDSAQVYMIEF